MDLFYKEAKHLITVQKPVYATDSLGGQTISNWDDIDQIWAIIRATRTKQNINAEQIQDQKEFEILIRYTAALDNLKESSNYRIILNSRILEIESIKNLDKDAKHIGNYYQSITAIERGSI